MAVFRRLASAAMMTVAALVFTGVASTAQQAPLPHPPLWKVQKGASTVYVFGSLHILPKDYRWGTPQIDAALGASDIFVFEVPLDEAAIEEEKKFVVENGFYLDGRTLKSSLSAAEFRRYSAILRGAGLPKWQVERYRPWLASVMLGLAYLHRGNVADLRGADETIVEYAQGHGKELRYLETVHDQMNLIKTGDERKQMKALKTMIFRLTKAREQERNIRESWSSGDAEGFTRLIDGYFAGRAEAKNLLIEGRNRTWRTPIKQYLESGRTTFVTVGAAHVGGDNGVLRLLCNEGYDVERVGDAVASTAKICGPKA